MDDIAIGEPGPAGPRDPGVPLAPPAPPAPPPPPPCPGPPLFPCGGDVGGVFPVPGLPAGYQHF